MYYNEYKQIFFSPALSFYIIILSTSSVYYVRFIMHYSTFNTYDLDI